MDSRGDGNVAFYGGGRPAGQGAGEPTRRRVELAALAAAGSPPPGALLAANDQMAIGALRAVKEAGCRVPEDLGVADIGDIATATCVDPPLTTVALPLQEMGAEAMRLLLALSDKKPGLPTEICLPTRLVVRASTSRPSGACS